MTYQFVIRGGGLAALLAGILAILLTLPALGLLDRWLHALQVVLMVFGISGVYLFQYRESGVLGLLGSLLAISGTILFLFNGQIAGLEYLAIGGIASGLGIILLAFGSWKAGKLPRWIPWMWILGSVVGIPSTFLVS